jgi:hypothetical protein
MSLQKLGYSNIDDEHEDRNRDNMTDMGRAANAYRKSFSENFLRVNDWWWLVISDQQYTGKNINTEEAILRLGRILPLFSFFKKIDTMK